MIASPVLILIYYKIIRGEPKKKKLSAEKNERERGKERRLKRRVERENEKSEWSETFAN